MSEAALSEHLMALREQYASNIAVRIAELRTAWCDCQRSLEDPAHVQFMELLAHNLAGSGATFGYNELSHLSRSLENILSRALDPEVSQDLQPQRRIDQLLDGIETAAAVSPRDLSVKSRPVGNIEVKGRSERLVFLVDDDTEATALLAAEIGHFGYAVQVLSDPSAIGPAMTQFGRPALVLMDIMFPTNPDGGLHAGKWISDAQTLQLPLIFLSTREDFDARLAAVRAGAMDYFVKPVDPVKLIERIDQLTAVHEPEPYRILIVEDDPALGEVYAVALQGAGMAIELVSDPRDTLERLDGFNADLILMDLYLPGCTGLDLAKVVRQDERLMSIPIVFLSTEVRIDRQLLAMSLGGDDFLTKPIEVDRLVASVTSRAQRARQLRSFMVKDSMTGLLNHASIISQLRIEVSRAKRSRASFSIALIDLDKFKSINDTYGHPVGDRVIKCLARLLRQRLRQTDTIGRYGGEEFAVLLPDTDAVQACKLIDELRKSFAALRQAAGIDDFNVTFSAGIASHCEHSDAGSLIDAADRALYQAKRLGRNRVEISTPDLEVDAPSDACRGAETVGTSAAAQQMP